MSILSAPFFHDEAAAHALVEEIVWPFGPVCPRCNGVARITRVKGGRVGLYRCGPCKRQFTVKIGTAFEDSHVPLNQWLQVVYMMVSSKKGVSSHQVMRTLEVQYKTAWFMTHRIREAMRPTGASPLGGGGKTVEADETFVGGKAENRAYSPVPSKQAVMALVERGGAARSFHVANVTAANLRPIIGKHVHVDTKFQSDESAVYTGIGWNFQSHGVVNHTAKEYVCGEDYTNTVEGYLSILKRGIFGIYHHVSEAHLHRYLCEYDFRYTHRVACGVDDMERMRVALAGIVGKRLTYRQDSGKWAAQAPA